MRQILAVMLLLSSACATSIDGEKPGLEWLVRLRSDGCEVVPYAVMWLAFCGDQSREHKVEWMTGTAEVVLAQDMALSELGLPPVSMHLENALVRLFDAPSPDGNFSGMYHGYKEPETKSISLWLKDGYNTPSHSALAHEFMHLYDHHELMVNNLAEWYEVVRHGRHFLVPVVAEYVIKHGKAGLSEKPNTALESIVCGLDHHDQQQSVMTDAGASNG